MDVDVLGTPVASAFGWHADVLSADSDTKGGLAAAAAAASDDRRYCDRDHDPAHCDGVFGDDGVVAPVFALTSSGLGTLSAIMAAGLVIGVFGHIIRSRILIVLGIAVIGAVSVYFGVFVAKVR